MSRDATPRAAWQLCLLAVISSSLYVWICRLSRVFAVDTDKADRPLLLVLSLFGLLFLLYLAAVRIAARSDQQKSIVRIVLLGALAFRGICLFSEPIQEVDIYRYLWDGAVTNAGVSPFRYAPGEIVQGLRAPNAVSPETELGRLVTLCQSDDGLRGVLQRVHWEQIKTVYPPVSQFVFAFVDRLTPTGTEVKQRVLIMRVALISFDLATLGIVLLILDQVSLPRGLAAGYGWCPLLVKECANSGHLDSIVVFLTTLGLYFILRAVRRQSDSETSRFSANSLATILLGGSCLALGVGAKIYPIVLLPWLVVVGWRKPWGYLALPVLFLLGSWLVMRPMFVDALPTSQSEKTAVNSSESDSGLAVFTKYWEMNDFLFLIGVENLKPDKPNQPTAWFVVVPHSLRTAWKSWSAETFGWEPHLSAFLTTRLITGLLFGLIASWLAWKARQLDTAQAWAEAAFYTIAWFWLLSPTQNPWYWTWALPLLPVIGSRPWWAISGLAFMYYLRFWFEYHCTGIPVLGTNYEGTLFFDFVVPWLEFGPWFVWLIVAYRAEKAARPA